MKILVTNCTRNSGLAVLRRLARNGHQVVGADDRRLPFGLHSRYAPPYELVPDEHADDYVDRLISLIERHRPDVLLPFAGAERVCREFSRFESITRVLVPAHSSFMALHDKKQVLEECQRDGIPCPAIISIDSAREALQDGSAQAIVIKPRANLGGGEGVRIVSEPDEVAAVQTALQREFGETLITEFVPGPDDSNVALQIVFDRSSRPIGYLLLRKLRINPLKIGIMAVGVSVHAPQLIATVLPLFQRLRWRGPADVEFKLDARTGQAKLIEVNARFSGSIGFAIACGVDLPELTCRAAMGERLPRVDLPTFAAGVKYWNPIMYLRSVRAEFRQGGDRLALLARMREETRGRRVGQPYQWTDPAPTVGKVLHQIRSYLQRYQGQ